MGGLLTMHSRLLYGYFLIHTASMKMSITCGYLKTLERASQPREVQSRSLSPSAPLAVGGMPLKEADSAPHSVY